MALLKRNALDHARLVECRRSSSAGQIVETLVIDLDVERPQVRKHDIAGTERVAVVFSEADERVPEVLALRTGFPSVPHVNIRDTELPRSLCLYDRNWNEVRIRWTPARFIERIRYWFAETARGTLHRGDQPLEPLLFGSGYHIVIPHDLFAGDSVSTPQRLTVRFVGPPDQGRVLIASRDTSQKGSKPRYVAAVMVCPPQEHGLIRHTPKNIAELHSLTATAGLDLVGALRTRIKAWNDPDIRGARLVIVIAFPKTRSGSDTVEVSDVWTFLTMKTPAAVGVAIGCLDDRGGTLAPLVVHDDAKRGESVEVEILATHFSLSRPQAAQLNGFSGAVDKNIVAVGLGSLGSQVQMNLMRSGFGLWTLIDNDLLLPHNLVRHAQDGFALGHHKVIPQRDAAASLFDGESIPTAIIADVLRPAKLSEPVAKAYAEAHLLLDMSASVAVARHLAREVASGARRASLFLNPAGTDLVLLMEDASREIPLDCLEMQYYRQVASHKRLLHHLKSPDGQIRYSQSCRDTTSTVSQDHVALLSAIGSAAVRREFESTSASIQIWQINCDTLEVKSVPLSPSPVHTQTSGDWTLVWDSALVKNLSTSRAKKLPNETGGVLVGAYDHARRIVYIIDSIPSPPDSKEWPTLYIRGSELLSQTLDAIRDQTAGNLEYIGEWHSHPRGHNARPSDDDLNVFLWLTRHMDDEGLPALMGIVADEGPVFFFGKMVWID